MTKRRLSINGRFLGRTISGVERYGREIVLALDRLLATSGDDLQARLLLPPHVECDLPLQAIKPETVGQFGGHAWEQTALALAAQGDVLLNLANSGPILHRRNIVVIHDAAPFRFPEAYSWRYRTVHRTLSTCLSRTATLATVSQFSRGELAEVFGVPAASIVVAPNGSDHLGRTTPDPDVTDRLGLRGIPFLFAVGSASRNKNIGLILEAWRRAGLEERCRLVIAGNVNDRVFNSDLAMADLKGLILPGRISDAELAALYQSADAFVFPSLYEGFGIPPLEAIAYGCPVLAAAIPAIREVCSDGAQYFAPDDPDAVARLMAQAIANPSRADAAAQARLARYQWADSAATLLATARPLLG